MISLTLIPLLAGCNGGGGGDPKPDETGTPPPDPQVCQDHAGESICDGQTAVQCDESGGIADYVPCDPTSEVCADGSCASCAPGFSVPYADPDRVAEGGITVEADAAGPSLDRPSRLRPVDLEGSVLVSGTGPLVILDPTGAPVDPETPVGPGTVLVGATAAGEGTVTLAPADPACSAAPLLLEVRAVDPGPIAVRTLDGFPWVETWDVFTARDTVSAHVDLAVHPDREGLPADVYVVPHGGEIAQAVAGPVPIEAVDGEPVPVWGDLPSTNELLAPYDLVVDFGRDGSLDPGDLRDGIEVPALYVGGDLSAPGPYTPTQQELSRSTRIRMVVYWPDPPDAVGAPMPLVVISHGNGHDYTWYDYLGRHLASHGYVVISHFNDTQPGPITASSTTRDNTDAFIEALPTEFGGVLDGWVDTHAIAWIGHSRGGEGVVIAYNDLVTGAETATHYTPDDIQLVSSIAPTVFEPPRNRVNPHGVTYHLIAGSRDGDVTGGVDNPVTQYLRILQNATGTRAVTYVQGADHNDFNCCGFDDAGWTTGPGPIIGRPRAQQLARAYYLALLEAVFHDRAPMWEYFARAPERFRPDGTEVVLANQLERADGDRKLVIDDFQANPEFDVSSSGGAVTATVRELAEGVLDDRNGQLTHDPQDPFNGMSQSENDPNPARGAVFQWDPGDQDLMLEFEVPADGRDATQFDTLAFRACQATRHPNTNQLASMLSFGVALVDGQGRVSEIDHRVYGGIPRPYARTGLGNGTGWVNEFQTVRIPIAAFAADGADIDLTDIVAVRLLFGAGHGSETGRIGLDDLVLLGPGAM